MGRFYLDFDGVIAHSAIECVNNAFSVWQETENDLFNNIDSSTISNAKSKIIDCCISNRYLVIPPEHYFCLIDAIFQEFLSKNKIPEDNQVPNLFFSKIQSVCPKILKTFKKNFFSLRDKKFVTLSDEDWVRENPETLFINQFYKIIKNNSVEVIVVSRKNYMAIKKWFLGSRLPVKEIYGNEALNKYDNNKYNLIESLQLKNQKNKAFFIDDMISEFDIHNWQKINVITLQAGWGYNDLDDNTQDILEIIKEHINDLSN
tara:strand:- start:770 stop:1549 length:780 start_codon:yes stop_codon:yes gene_type:complete